MAVSIEAVNYAITLEQSSFSIIHESKTRYHLNSVGTAQVNTEAVNLVTDEHRDTHTDRQTNATP